MCDRMSVARSGRSFGGLQHLTWCRSGYRIGRKSHRAGGEVAMQPFTIHEGLVIPLDRANVDTDAIIPKQFLKSIKRTGFGPSLFDDARYLDPGEPGMDHGRP